MKIVSIIVLMLISKAVSAGWTLCNEASSLNFISTINSNILEAHSFSNMAGTISDNGDAILKVDLISIETNNSKRDELVRNVVFEVNKYQELSASIKLNIEQLTSQKNSSPVQIQVNATVKLHGISKEIETKLLITRLKTGCLLITSMEPIMLSLADYELLEGLEKLRTVANLDSIAKTVPVTFTLFFKKDQIEPY